MARWRLRCWGAVGLMLCAGVGVGCRDKAVPGDAKAGGTSVDAKAAAGREASAGAVRAPAGRDGEDDDLAPSCLPRSNAVGDWVKYEPIKMFAAKTLASAMSDDEAARLAHFQLKSAARCTYARPAGGRLSLAEVLVVEAVRPEDAYGVLTCQSSSPESAKVGGLTRVERNEAIVFHCWQGKNYIRVASRDREDEPAEQVRRLVQYIAARIQQEDAPALVEALPVQAALPGRRWVVRHLASLRAADLKAMHAPDPEAASTLLGLGPETLVAIGSYEVPSGRQPNTVWIVRYPTPEAARDAHARYTRFLESDGSPVSQATNLLEPSDRFVVGTWTAEEESLQYMMPRIAQLLPS